MATPQSDTYIAAAAPVYAGRTAPSTSSDPELDFSAETNSQYLALQPSLGVN